MSALLIKSFDFKANNNYPFQMPSVKTRGLIFFFNGLTSGATAVTRANLGRLQILRNGKEINSEISFERLDAARLLYSRSEIGTPHFSSAGGAGIGFSIAVYKPFFVPGDREQVDEFDQSAVVKVIHDDLTSILTSANCDVYAVPGLGVKKYEMNMNDFSIPTDSGLVKPRQLAGVRNLFAVGIDYSANHTNFRLTKDDGLIYDLSLTDLNSLSSPGDVVRALETVLPADSYVEAGAGGNNFDPYLFRLDKQGIESANGDNYGVSVVSTSQTASGFLASVTYRELTTQMSVANYAEKIHRNRMRSARNA